MDIGHTIRKYDIIICVYSIQTNKSTEIYGKYENDG